MLHIEATVLAFEVMETRPVWVTICVLLSADSGGESAHYRRIQGKWKEEKIKDGARRQST